MTVDILQILASLQGGSGGVLRGVSAGTLLNVAAVLLNIGIAVGNWRAGRRQKERLEERVGDLETEGSSVTQEQIDALRRDVERLNDYLEPVIQERLRRGEVVRFRRGDVEGGEEQNSD